MIRRDIQRELKRLLKEYPVVVILGPRQSGKTTLAKSLDYQYHNLEEPETRHLAIEDPKAFFHQMKKPVILDEVQRAPELLKRYSFFKFVPQPFTRQSRSDRFQ